MNIDEQVLINILKYNTIEMAFSYLGYHIEKFGLPSDEARKNIIKIMEEKMSRLEDNNNFVKWANDYSGTETNFNNSVILNMNILTSAFIDISKSLAIIASKMEKNHEQSHSDGQINT